MRTFGLQVAAFSALVFAIGACRSDKEGDSTIGVRGVLEVESTAPDGLSHYAQDAVLDFGSVFMGQHATLKIRFANSGRANLTITGFEKVDGSEVAVGGPENAGAAPFHVSFVQPLRVDSAGRAEIEATFAPPETEDVTRPYEVKLLVRAEGTATGAAIATVTLKGIAEAGVCELPEPVKKDPVTGALVLDFGAVATGTNFTHSVLLRNPTPLVAEALVGDIQGPDAGAYSFAPESIRGAVQLQPGEERAATLVFTPDATKTYSGRISMRASTRCPAKVVELVGQGVKASVTWEPAAIDCGFTQVGSTVTRPITFKNQGLAEVQLSGFRTDKANEFRLEPAPEDGLVLPGNGGTATVNLVCRPSANRAFAGFLSFRTNLEDQASGQIPLKVRGGGPEIETSPRNVLDFGKVGYLPNTPVTFSQTRKLTILNVGSKPHPVPAGENPNLVLGRYDASKKGHTAPYFVLTPEPGTAPGEIEATLASTYNPDQGLAPEAGRNSVELQVKVTPRSLGPKAAKLTLYSNDADEPELVVRVQANAQEVADCEYAVTPAGLDFGLISPPNSVDLEFRVKSLLPEGAGGCLIGNIDLKKGSDESYSLPAGAVEGRELQPGEELRVRVRASPRSLAAGTDASKLVTATGIIEVNVASTRKPRTEVPLNTSIGLACLTVAPDELDFGTVALNCRSAPKTFSIYNTCPTPVFIQGIEASNASASPEFVVTSNPVVAGTPVELTASKPLEFAVAYAPGDNGSDTGSIQIQARQGGKDVTYVVALAGEGDKDGKNRDDFRQDARPKADILFVVDNSGSMVSIQESLSNNFKAFIDYAQQKKVEYQIAVITTDNAEFRGGESATEPRVLTPSTLNVEEAFARRVKVGTKGDGKEKVFEPALAAFLPPLVTTTNKGFLREDASLAIIAVTDENDQSAGDLAFFHNRFLNIKGFNQANLFSFNAVAYFDADNCHGGAKKDDGRLLQMVMKTDGIREEVCTDNWAKTLEQLGKRAGGFKSNFFLTSPPDMTRPLTVTIDGQNVPQRDPTRPTDSWWYDAKLNAVSFDPNWTPEPGVSLKVEYFARCN